VHNASPPGELAPGEALRLDTLPTIALCHAGAGEIFACDDTRTHQDATPGDGRVEDFRVECHAPPAKLPVRHHEVTVIDGDIRITESTGVPNVPHGGRTATSKRQPVNPNQRTCSWL
jgi:3-phenylpropionate/trans-cinnamate dioxygenase ferredoxin subunit